MQIRMSAVQSSRKGTLYLESFMLLFLTLFQISLSDHETVGPLQLNVPVDAAIAPYLGTLSQPLKVGSLIEVQGYVPPDTRQFHINLCTDCSNGPIHLHISVRYDEGVVVRNSYENDAWKTEERDEKFPFAVNRKFVLLIEVRASDYRISVNGDEVWTFKHGVPYQTVEKFEINGEPIGIWKIEYTDIALREETDLQLNGDVGMNQRTILDIRCECACPSSVS